MTYLYTIIIIIMMIDAGAKKMSETNIKKILFEITISILLIMTCVVSTSAGLFGMQEIKADFTESGHIESDFDVDFMGEWWYLNGNAKLVANDGENRDIGFFVVLSHQESPYISQDGTQLSHLLTFYGIYTDDDTPTFNSTETFVPQTSIGNYIALNRPYINYVYPDGLKKLCGSAFYGYTLNYTSDVMEMNLFFQPNTDKTIDQAHHPLDFITYEHSCGSLNGYFLLDGKRYEVTHAEGYMDHMIPISSVPWSMDMHGWSWFEVTTDNYQAVAYAIRGLDDGYDGYSYKHLTLLSKDTGDVVAEYSADEITIIETDWMDENEFNRKRPAAVTFSTRNMNVTVVAENVIDFDGSDPTTATGFVDFMAFQPANAVLQYDDNIEKGSAFYEYLVTDMGIIEGNNPI
jgi:hypothetical protein